MNRWTDRSRRCVRRATTGGSLQWLGKNRHMSESPTLRHPNHLGGCTEYIFAFGVTTSEGTADVLVWASWPPMFYVGN